MIGGRYRLRSPLGAGAMGEVWRAEHVTLGTSIAVKLVDTANRNDAAEILGRFAQEARAAASLKSPHVVQILDHGADGHVAFIAMEMLEGESLEQRLARRGRLLPSEVAHVVREISRGVERAHAAGIVHRDLKPPNIFLARVEGSEVVKVLDFGIAKLLGVPREAHLQTQAGFVVGTPAYMSPEQVLGHAVDHRSDLWQMGVIAFECITGKRPFEGETLGQIFLAICSAALPVPSAVAMPGTQAVPPMLAAFDAWFARSLSRDPALRFQSAGEMAEALGAVLSPAGVGESATPTVATSHRGPPRSSGATGHNDAWSTGRVEPRPPASPRAFLVGLSIAPILVLSAAGVWWWRAHAGAATSSVSATTATAAVPTSTASATAATASATAATASTIAATASATAAAEPSAAPTATVAASGSASEKPSAAARPSGHGRPVKQMESDRIGL
ncbi:Putative serine/threonine-protein kinase pknH [Minicystis rosea]|nr:Putative serine/threonine-protein kinase pknH [Minicystis rosea]